MENHHVQVLLIALGDQHSDERQALPLGIAVLKGVLQSHGFSVKCIDNMLMNLDVPTIVPTFRRISAPCYRAQFDRISS